MSESPPPRSSRFGRAQTESRLGEGEWMLLPNAPTDEFVGVWISWVSGFKWASGFMDFRG
jgi:hypothetical protein